MSKFVIECPGCGRYAEAKTGLFAKKKIDCSCGYTIDVRTDKLISRECPHCGNQVVFDQSKGADAKCPVCGEPINTMAEQNKILEFTCGQCGIHLTTAKTALTYTCPVCDYENDVQERLVQERIREEGIASIIKYEGDNHTFVWKHPIEDFNFGSQLIVHESQEAIFFRDGQALDLFGPGRYTLETAQLPLLEKAYQLPTDTGAAFHCEVYFINKTVQMGIKWGTPDKVRFIDPLTGVPLELGASGELNLMVEHSRKLVTKLVGTMKGISWDEGAGFTKSLQSSFRPLIVSAVKTNLGNVIKNEAIDLLEIDAHLDVISKELLDKIQPGFEEYGLTIPQFYVTNVVLPEQDPNFKRIKELHTITLQTRMFQAEATVKTAQAQSEAQYRTAEEQSKAVIEAAHREAELQRQTTETEIARREAERRLIEAQAEAQSLRMQGLTEAEIMRAKGYSEKDVLQAEVQKAYAAGIGEMGSGISIGGGNGGGGGGLMGDIMGLSVGMAAANAMMPQIGNMMQGFNPQSPMYGQAQQPQNTVGAAMGQQQEDSAGVVMGQQPQNTVGAAMGQQQENSAGAVMGQQSQNTVGAAVSQQPGNIVGATIEQQSSPSDTWNCNCGKTGLSGNFCSNCGGRKPEPQTGWNCSCGSTGNTGMFCENCGKKQGE